VCGGSVNLKDSKTDEHGLAVHENCYVWTVELKKSPRKIVATLMWSESGWNCCLSEALAVPAKMDVNDGELVTITWNYGKKAGGER
jgi:hypothetical protein